MFFDFSAYPAIANKSISEPIAPNATITLHLLSAFPGELLDEDGLPVVDDVGNPVLITGTKTISCFMRQKSLPSSDIAAGINTDLDYFIGRLIDPPSYQFPPHLSTTDTVTINGRTGQLKIIRNFETPISIQHEIPDKLGQRIAVYVSYVG